MDSSKRTTLYYKISFNFEKRKNNNKGPENVIQCEVDHGDLQYKYYE